MAAFKSAVDLWKRNNLNKYADASQFTKIRQIINGGNNGMEVMRHFLAIAKTIWKSSSDVTQAVAIYQDDNLEQIMELQQKLYALGYTEVGRDDGEDGPYTRAAVLAFRDDNGLPPGGIDDALLDAVDNAKPRVTARTATPPTNQQIRLAVPEVLSAFYNRIVSGALAVFAFFGTLFNAITNNFSDAEQKVAPFQAYLSSVPGWAWCSLIMIVSLVIYMLSQRGEASGVKAYKTGERR